MQAAFCRSTTVELHVGTRRRPTLLHEASVVGALVHYTWKAATDFDGNYDAALFTLIQDGDERALAALYDRYSNLVYSIALRICSNSSDAEDVLQDIFLQIWRCPHQFDPSRGRLSSWLATVSRNRSIGILRTRKKLQPIDGLNLPSNIDLRAEAEFEIMIERTETLILTLPVQQREALDMAFFGGMSHYEIAAATGLPLGTIKTRIRGALSHLRQMYRTCNGNPLLGAKLNRSAKIAQRVPR